MASYVKAFQNMATGDVYTYTNFDRLGYLIIIYVGVLIVSAFGVWFLSAVITCSFYAYRHHYRHHQDRMFRKNKAKSRRSHAYSYNKYTLCQSFIMQKDLPRILVFPRLQIICSMIAVPCFAFLGSMVMQQNLTTPRVALPVIVLLLFVLATLVLYFLVIYLCFLTRDVYKRPCNYVVKRDVGLVNKLENVMYGTNKYEEDAVEPQGQQAYAQAPAVASVPSLRPQQHQQGYGGPQTATNTHGGHQTPTTNYDETGSIQPAQPQASEYDHSSYHRPIGTGDHQTSIYDDHYDANINKHDRRFSGKQRQRLGREDLEYRQSNMYEDFSGQDQGQDYQYDDGHMQQQNGRFPRTTPHARQQDNGYSRDNRLRHQNSGRNQGMPFRRNSRPEFDPRDPRNQGVRFANDPYGARPSPRGDRANLPGYPNSPNQGRPNFPDNRYGPPSPRLDPRTGQHPNDVFGGPPSPSQPRPQFQYPMGRFQSLKRPSEQAYFNQMPGSARRMNPQDPASARKQGILRQTPFTQDDSPSPTMQPGGRQSSLRAPMQKSGGSFPKAPPEAQMIEKVPQQTDLNKQDELNKQPGKIDQAQPSLAPNLAQEQKDDKQLQPQTTGQVTQPQTTGQVQPQRMGKEKNQQIEPQTTPQEYTTPGRGGQVQSDGPKKDGSPIKSPPKREGQPPKLSTESFAFEKSQDQKKVKTPTEGQRAKDKNMDQIEETSEEDEPPMTARSRKTNATGKTSKQSSKGLGGLFKGRKGSRTKQEQLQSDSFSKQPRSARSNRVQGDADNFDRGPQTPRGGHTQERRESNNILDSQQVTTQGTGAISRQHSDYELQEGHNLQDTHQDLAEIQNEQNNEANDGQNIYEAQEQKFAGYNVGENVEYRSYQSKSSPRYLNTSIFCPEYEQSVKGQRNGFQQSDYKEKYNMGQHILKGPDHVSRDPPDDLELQSNFSDETLSEEDVTQYTPLISGPESYRYKRHARVRKRWPYFLTNKNVTEGKVPIAEATVNNQGKQQRGMDEDDFYYEFQDGKLVKVPKRPTNGRSQAQDGRLQATNGRPQPQDGTLRYLDKPPQQQHMPKNSQPTSADRQRGNQSRAPQSKQNKSDGNNHGFMSQVTNMYTQFHEAQDPYEGVNRIYDQYRDKHGSKHQGNREGQGYGGRYDNSKQGQWRAVFVRLEGFCSGNSAGRRTGRWQNTKRLNDLTLKRFGILFENVRYQEAVWTTYGNYQDQLIRQVQNFMI